MIMVLEVTITESYGPQLDYSLYNDELETLRTDEGVGS